jgi:branched-chain amino acid transport system permease protein
MTMRLSLARILGAAVLGAAIVAILSIKLNAFRDYQIAEIAIYVTAIAGLTVLTGLSGQISLGNGAFMAIGAYTTALLLLHLGWPFIAALVISGIVTAATGAIVGVAAARLHGPYLAGATLMLGVALPSLAFVYPGFLGGDQGLDVLYTAPGFLGVNFPLTRWEAWVCSAVALVTLVLLANLGRSRVGRNWRAVRDNEVAASLAGVNVARARVLAFVVSATCAGLAGALLAVITALVAPGAFTITLSIALLTGAVIGGLGTLLGAIWGSLVIVLVPTYATDVATSHGLSASVASNIPIAAYGGVLILVMLIFPQGIQGGVRWVLRLFVGPGGRPPGTPRAASQGGRTTGTPRLASPGGRATGAPRSRLPGAPAAGWLRGLARPRDDFSEPNEKEGTQ